MPRENDVPLVPPVNNDGLIVYDGLVPGDVDIFADDVGEPTTALLITTLVLTLASIGYSIYAFITAPDDPDNPDRSTSFGFGLRNSFNPTDPIQVIYGEHKMAGHYFFSQMSNIKTNNLLSLGVGIGEGPIDSVSDIKVNNVAITDIQASSQVGTVDTFLGDISVPSSGTGGVADIFYEPGFTQDFNDPIVIDGGVLTRTTLGNTVTRLEVGFFFPAGNFEVNDEKGKIRSRAFKMEIDYRKVGAAEYTEGPRINQKIKNVSAFRLQQFVAKGLEAGQYQIRFTNNSTENPSDPTTNGVNLDFIQEGVDLEGNLFSVGDFSYLALNLEATGTINGTPTVTAVVKGRTVDVYSDEDTFANIWSDNPSWCILDFLTNPRYGIGNLVQIDQIDIQSFIDVGTFCQQTDSNGARKGRLNLVMEDVRPAVDWLALMLKSFGGFLQLVGGQIALGVEKDEASTQSFDQSNILVGTLQYDMASAQDTTSVNRVNITFRNREKDFATDNFRLQVDAEISTEVDVVARNIDLFGVTYPLDVERQARRFLNILRTNIRVVEFEADMSTVEARIGDVISITHTLPGWVSKKFRIVTIEELQDQTRKISALEHNSSVYTVEGSITSAVANTTLFNPFVPASGVETVDLVPEFHIRADGSIQNNLDISWDYPSFEGSYLGLDSFEIFWASEGPELELPSGTNFNSSDEDSIFFVTGSGTVLSGTVGFPNTLGQRAGPTERFFEIQDVDDGIFVYVQVLPVTTAGARLNQSLEPVFSTYFPTYSGQPSNSDIFTAAATLKDVLLTWSKIPPNEAPDLAGFEIRTEDANFGVDDSNLVFRGNALSFVDKDVASRSKTYYLRAFNNSNLYSVASVSESLAGSAPAAVTLGTPRIEGANIFLDWSTSAESTVIGYEVHVSGTTGFTPSDASLVDITGGIDTTNYRFQDERHSTAVYLPNYFKVAGIDSVSVELGDQNYSNQVTASGEDLTTVKSVTGDVDPPLTLSIGPLNATRLDDSIISFTTVERSAISIKANFGGIAGTDEGDKTTVFAEIRRGVGITPVLWEGVFIGPNFDLTPGQEFSQNLTVVDFPGAPKTIPIDDGHWSYVLYFTQISGAETISINQFAIDATESR